LKTRKGFASSFENRWEAVDGSFNAGIVAVPGYDKHADRSIKAFQESF
jgi:hypothetical protein